jgi:hypothetical protein
MQRSVEALMEVSLRRLASKVQRLFAIAPGPGVPRQIRVSRGILAAQSLGVGCGGALALSLALFSFAVGTSWLFFLASSGVGLGLLTIAAILGWLRTKLSASVDLWTLAVAMVQVGLIFSGATVLALTSNYQPGTPQTPGTDGPFADGGEGAIALMSYLSVGGGAAITVLLFWHAIKGLLRRKHGARSQSAP